VNHLLSGDVTIILHEKNTEGVVGSGFNQESDVKVKSKSVEFLASYTFSISPDSNNPWQLIMC